MPFFSYKARSARGELLQGILEGADAGAVADQLFSNGASPIDIVPSRKPASEGDRNWWSSGFRRRVGALDVQLFSRQLHTLLKSGVPIMRGLAGLEESATNKSFAVVLKDIRESLDAGRELSAAMHRHSTVFSPFYLSLVRVGEATGRMDEIFLRLFGHLEFEREMRERVRSALRYPMFVLLAMLAAIVVINIFVIPSFARVYAGFRAELPLLTRMLVASSRFTLHYWLHMLLAASAAAFAFRFYIRTPQGRLLWDRAKLRLPIAGKIILKATLARFARSFATVSKSGVPIVQGLAVVAQTVDNAYVAARVEQMRDGVERGESILRTAAASGVFTPVVLQMIAVGEETGALDELMNEIAHMYEREVDYELKTLSAQIEPILITGLGVLVLILALGVFLPLWDLGKAAVAH